jgi:hypothetical protein
MLPEISKLQFETEDVIEENPVLKSYKWNFESGDFELIDGRLVEVEGLDYIKVWIEKILRTRKDLEIYTTYGSGHQDLIGTVYDRDFVQSEITRIIREALSTNDAIEEVGEATVEFEGSMLTINFKVNTIYGSMEVSV